MTTFYVRVIEKMGDRLTGVYRSVSGPLKEALEKWGTGAPSG
jgi:hypothetical protein